MSIGLLFHLNPSSEHSLQKQIVEQIASAIINGHIPLDTALPSSRNLARQLNVGRNTVILAYERLVEDSYLIARERTGYFVNPQILDGAVSRATAPASSTAEFQPDWKQRFKLHASRQRKIEKPRDWKKYPYPFVYGQISDELFPLYNWRECCRDALSAQAVRRWSEDRPGTDDPMLIEQIHTRLLPRRGIWANPEQILITVGAQHALYLLSQLLLDKDSVIGLENPGYVDIRNIASLGPARIKALALDSGGLLISNDLDECDYIYVTPSHQSPTTVTMPLENRYRLLEKATESNIVLIEDDYESEFNYQSKPLPALKSLDSNDRVIYVGSLSKTIAPGLRMGYLVGPQALIGELRSLRHLMLRQPAANNQQSLALFLARGYHDSLISNLLATYRERYHVISAALQHFMPGITGTPGFGGSSLWIQGPPGLNANELAHEVAQAGIIIEPGDIYFQQEEPPRQFFRLGFSAIDTPRIEPGIKLLSEYIERASRSGGD